MQPQPISEALKEWASPEQVATIDAVIKAGGNMRAAALAMGKHPSTVANTINRVRRRAATSGFSPQHDMTHPAAPGFIVKGTTTLYNEDGSLKLQWVKTKADDEARARFIQEAYAAMATELPRMTPSPLPVPHAAADSLCNLFTITDFHMGMLAWHKEGGADWDLKIAEETLYRFFESMLQGAPRARVAVINQLGDFLHQDGLRAETPTSGHLVDSDGRFSKIVQAALRALRRVIDRALETHEEVHVIMAEGNHDIVSSMWLRTMFSALYENEPRVTVNSSEIPYYAYRWGSTLLGFHHGHLAKNASLPAIFSQQYRREWGATDRCHIHTGHRHHLDFKEYPGAMVFQHPTMTARDAFAARGGWISERQGMCMTYHLRFGHVGTNIVTPDMLVAA